MQVGIPNVTLWDWHTEVTKMGPRGEMYERILVAMGRKVDLTTVFYRKSK